MGFHHVVSFRWETSVPDDHVDRASAALDALCAVVPGVVTFRHGPDAGINPGNFEYAIAAEFESEEHYLGYRDHPQHKEFVATFVAGHVAERAAVQFRS